MTQNNTTTNVHNNSTEFLIVISQTVFFVLLFLMLKSALVDRRGMMYDKNRIVEEKLQLLAIFFAIFVFVGIIMIPLESYEYAHFVIPLTYFIMMSILGFELYIVFNRDQDNERRSMSPTPVPIATTTSPTSSVWVPVAKDTGRRPFNF
jgi:uncharacterized membrane protein YsdA (DUF1294 family)